MRISSILFCLAGGIITSLALPSGNLEDAIDHERTVKLLKQYFTHSQLRNHPDLWHRLGKEQRDFVTKRLDDTGKALSEVHDRNAAVAEQAYDEVTKKHIQKG
ncbi:hypothetical protein F5148DRAFT_1373008 [Russula earlei]|uniref:Uncharacterized protein n=1 Tax=Russula earlei TaxID=71964 RepID=A0ACC0UMN4_9AGAM|nr:hypothetical protein F5148DRAFT_1373008 [Russula earlei]